MDSPQYRNNKIWWMLGIRVLNLIINGQSSILYNRKDSNGYTVVLNLIINGQSSILKNVDTVVELMLSFKPYYKWIVLNTNMRMPVYKYIKGVLNLIINGQSSILRRSQANRGYCYSFKPYYKWIVLNTWQGPDYYGKEEGSYCFKPYYKWIVLNTITMLYPPLLTILGFKPYYKWIVLNTNQLKLFFPNQIFYSFKPYYKWIVLNTDSFLQRH